MCYEAHGEPTVYVTGDTIWCEEVEHAIKENQPNVIVCFAGAARFCTGNPITMDEQDILQVCQAAPYAQVLAVHMEAWNHCRLTRDKLRDYLRYKGCANKFRFLKMERFLFSNNIGKPSLCRRVCGFTLFFLDIPSD